MSEPTNAQLSILPPADLEIELEKAIGEAVREYEQRTRRYVLGVKIYRYTGRKFSIETTTRARPQ